MPPQTPPPPTPNYDFFMNPAPPPKRSLIPTGSSLKQRVIVVVGGGVALMILIIIFSSVFLGNHTNTTSLVTIAQQQNELVRVATEGDQQATQQTTKNLVLNIELGLTTNQQQLLAYLKKVGQTPSTKELAATQSATTDQQLTAAAAASNYDPVLVGILQNQLTKYTQTLKQTFAATKSTTQRQLINTDYEAAVLLLKQANSASTALAGS